MPQLDRRATLGDMLSWTIEELCGREWGPEIVWRDVPALDELPANLSVAVDDEHHVPAQVDGGRVAFVADLPAGACRHYAITASPEGSASPDLLTVDDDDTAFITNTAGAGLRLAWGGMSSSASLLGLRRRDGSWATTAGGWSGVAIERREDEILANGPVLARLRQRFHLVGDATVELTWEADAASPAIRLDVEVAGQPVEGFLTLPLGEVCTPAHAYWRPHSPSPWRGGTDGNHKRQIYHVPACADGEGTRPAIDQLEIGPFYNWARDAASFWTCWGQDSTDLLYVGWVRPSRTRLHGPLQRLQLRATRDPDMVELQIPLQRGRRRLVLAVLDRNQVSITTDGSGGDIDRLHARWNGPGLDDLQRMDLQVAAHVGGGHPRLWLGKEDVAAARSRLAAWPWMQERFAAQAAKPGIDPAGAYLASGDEEWASVALTELAAQLEDMVELLLDYGPTTDGALGISLARRWRSLLINLDLVLGSATAGDRSRILRQLAFVAEVQWTDDAWPANDSGIERGNDNFHPDVVSARGMAAAFLDGHPRQQQWLAAAVTEMGAFLDRYHTASGAGREAATYQLVSLGYALQLHVAAVRRGQEGLAELPAFRRAFEFLAATQTPVDERCGYRMLPTVGHVTVYAWCQTLQACFAWAARATAGTDFSRRMMRAWQRGGGHVISLHDYQQNSVWTPPLLLLDHQLPGTTDDDDLRESRVHEGLGAVLRTHRADGSEGYLLAKMGDCHGHFDQDEGSFLWYAWGQPVLADFGTQYDPNFHAHPWLHNRISFDHKADAAPRRGRLVAYHLDDGFDYLCGEVRVSRQFFHGEWPDRDPDHDFRQAGDPWELETEQVWRRHLLYLHALETVVLLDEIDGTLPTDWNLQVHADSVRTTASTAVFTGRFGIDLDVKLLRPTESDLMTSGYSHLGFDEPRGAKGWWRSARWTAAPGTQMTNMAEQALILRAHARPGQPYFAVLAARPASQAQTRFETVGEWDVRVVTPCGEATISTSAPFRRWYVTLPPESGGHQIEIEPEG